MVIQVTTSYIKLLWLISKLQRQGQWKVQEQKLKTSLSCSDKNPLVVDHVLAFQGSKLGSSKIGANIGIIRVQLLLLLLLLCVCAISFVFFFSYMCIIYE